MKKLVMVFAALVMTLTASAQFESGKRYISTDVNGINLSYNGAKDFSLGVDLNGGMFVANNWMVKGQIGFSHETNASPADVFSIGAGGRYYIQENGLYAGVNCKFVFSNGYNDVLPGIELGYCFFLNGSLTVEPAVYYDQSIRWHSDYSTVGLKIGLGYYF